MRAHLILACMLACLGLAASQASPLTQAVRGYAYDPKDDTGKAGKALFTGNLVVKGVKKGKGAVEFIAQVTNGKLVYQDGTTPDKTFPTFALGSSGGSRKLLQTTPTGTLPVLLGATGSCSVLQLNIGAIHLDLLGLVVDLAPVNLDITAVPGAGNLLGNLLCAVAGLLNGGLNLNVLVLQLTTIINTLLSSLG